MGPGIHRMNDLTVIQTTQARRNASQPTFPLRTLDRRTSRCLSYPIRTSPLMLS
jgi:hypothetical protein